MEERKYEVVVIGGGASGIAAAISAKRRGASILICEKTPRLGKKILASGNGRCNLSNDDLDSRFYNSASRPLVNSVFFRFGKSAIESFFKGIGVRTHSEDGRIFPVTGQSASVLKALEIELRRLSIPVETGFDVSAITKSAAGSGFTVSSRSRGDVTAKSVIVACGGKSYPALGSDGSVLKLAQRLGHTVIEPVPVAVPLIVKDPLCHALQGQKIAAIAKAVINGKETESAAGDLLFTKYGLSCTAILDVSQSVSIAINREGVKDVTVIIDMIPFMEEVELADELSKRVSRETPPDEMAVGLLPNKLCIALSDLFRTKEPAKAAKALKSRAFKVSGTRGWNEADFTAGGIDVNEIDHDSMESKLKKGIYFAGEILDVNGRRGGYNLAWAWASGFVAGEAAANA